MKWFLFIVQIILAIFLAFFAYKQMNQNHLDTWFTVFIVFFFIFVFWYDDRYRHADSVFSHNDDQCAGYHAAADDLRGGGRA